MRPLPAQTVVQGPARERALLARSESLLTWAVKRDSAAQSQRQTVWQARIVESDGFVLVLPSVVSVADAKRGLDSARSLLRDFGGIPEAFARSLVLFSVRAISADSVMDTLALRGRRRVQVGLTGTPGDGETVDGWDIAAAVMKVFAESRDSTWAKWLPAEFGISGWPRNHAWGAYRELTESPWSVGARCVAGQPAGCRLWLGLDRDSAPYTMRYTAADLRAFYSKDALQWWVTRSEKGVACLQGDDDGCVALASQSGQPDRHPAENAGRRSLVRAVHALHGRAALALALADSTGSVGERFARATGISEDSLVREWRYWVLTRGGRPRDRSLAAEAAPVLLAAGLLLFVAARSRG